MRTALACPLSSPFSTRRDVHMLDEEARGLDLGGAPRRRGGGGRWPGAGPSTTLVSARPRGRRITAPARRRPTFSGQPSMAGRRRKTSWSIPNPGTCPPGPRQTPPSTGRRRTSTSGPTGGCSSAWNLPCPLALSAADRAELAVGFAHSLTDAGAPALHPGAPRGPRREPALPPDDKRAGQRRGGSAPRRNGSNATTRRSRRRGARGRARR